MTDSSNDRSFVPEGWHTITPRIVVQGAKQFVEFLAHVFSATGDFQEARPSEVWIGDSVVMVSEVGVRSATPAFLYVYVGNTDTVYELALAAGVRAIEPPLDTPYGDRRCMVEDRWGNVWQSPHTARLAMPPNPSIEGTSTIRLRLFAAAPHVKR